MLKNIHNTLIGFSLDEFVNVDEIDSEGIGENGTNGAFTASHETRQKDERFFCRFLMRGHICPPKQKKRPNQGTPRGISVISEKIDQYPCGNSESINLDPGTK